MLSLLQCSMTEYLGMVHTKVGSGLAVDPCPAHFRISTLTRQSSYFMLGFLVKLLYRLEDDNPVSYVPVDVSIMIHLSFASEASFE